MTSIAACVENNSLRILELLVAVPGAVPQKDLDQGLILATRKNHDECAEMLLRAGASTNSHSSPENTVLRIAAETGHHKIIKLLAEAGCDVNERLGTQGTALHFATRQGKEASVQELLQAKADTEVRNSEGCTPILLSAIYRKLKVMKLLIDARCDLNKADNRNRTALHYACHKAIGCELLLSAGANPDIQDSDGNAPIHMASVEGFDPVVKCLVTYNCNPDLVNEFKLQAIHYLSMKDHSKGIEDIAHAGGDVNMPDRKGNIPLWYAVNHNRPKAVKALLRANCKADPPTREEAGPSGGVPLKTALEKRLFAIAKLLILAGCDLCPLYEWLTEKENQEPEEEQPSLFVLDDEEEEESDEEEDPEELAEKDALEWFEDWLHKPHSLQQACRIYIRQHLGPGIRKREDALPLPQSIRDYITLREVEDHHIEGFVM